MWFELSQRLVAVSREQVDSALVRSREEFFESESLGPSECAFRDSDARARRLKRIMSKFVTSDEDFFRCKPRNVVTTKGGSYPNGDCRSLAVTPRREPKVKSRRGMATSILAGRARAGKRLRVAVVHPHALSRILDQNLSGARCVMKAC